VYTWAVFFHLIFVAFWLGGILFTAAVLVPATRKKLIQQKGILFSELGTRFSRISWVIFPLLIFTGYIALLGRGFSTEDIFSAGFWETHYGSRLMIKLHLFALVLIVSGVHDFWLGPKAANMMEESPGTAKTERMRKASSWAGRLNMILGLAILFYAVGLVRG
jgi:copper resistance protein D